MTWEPGYCTDCGEPWIGAEECCPECLDARDADHLAWEAGQ